MTLSRKKTASTTSSKKPRAAAPVPAADDGKTITFRCDQPTLDLADDLGHVLDLTRTDTFKLGLRLVQRHLDSLLERSEPISELVTRHVPSLKRFDAALGRYSAGGRSELASIWRDFDAIQRIEIADVRNDALDNLKERLTHLFNRAKKERVPLPPMIVEVDLA